MMPYAPSAESRTDENGNEIPWITITANAHHIPDLLTAEIAAVVIEWGTFEHALVSDTSILLQQFPWTRHLANESPRSFKKKIVLWKQVVLAAFPNIACYVEAATEVCSKAKTVSRHRNRLIHGAWIQPTQPGRDYQVVNMKALRHIEEFERIVVTVEYVQALRNDIVSLSEALNGFMVNRMLHAHLGLLKATSLPTP